MDVSYVQWHATKVQRGPFGAFILAPNPRRANMIFTNGRRQERAKSPRFLVNAVDRLGRPIESCVHAAAQEIAPQAVSYAEKFLADPCVAMNLLEEAAATVSESVRAKLTAELPPIRDLRAYLYRSFLRKVAAKRKGEIQLDEAFADRLRLNEGR